MIPHTGLDFTGKFSPFFHFGETLDRSRELLSPEQAKNNRTSVYSWISNIVTEETTCVRPHPTQLYTFLILVNDYTTITDLWTKE